MRTVKVLVRVRLMATCRATPLVLVSRWALELSLLIVKVTVSESVKETLMESETGLVVARGPPSRFEAATSARMSRRKGTAPSLVRRLLVAAQG